MGQSLLIRNINVIDVNTGDLKADQDVLVVDNKISKVGKRLKGPEGAITLEGVGKFLMPGLIDGHIHFFQTGSVYTRPDAIDLRQMRSYEEERELAFESIPDQFLRYLRLGITTVVDVGGPFQNFQIRDEVTQQHLSPNVLVTGPLFSSVSREKLALNDPPIAKIPTIETADSLFDKMLTYDPDLIKIWYIVSKELPAEKTYPVMAHIAKRARENNLPLAVHATNLNTAKLAVKIGADVLVHSVSDQVVDHEFITALKQNDVTYIPTLLVGKNYGRTFLSSPSNHPQDLAWADPFLYGTLTDLLKYNEKDLPQRVVRLRDNPGQIWESYAKSDSIMDINLYKLVKAGVNIATGTDAGNIGTMHASSYFQELESMQRAGLSTEELVKASTIQAAKAYGLDKELGTIEAGKLADLIVLDKNPLELMDHLNTIEYVVKSGRLIKTDTLIKESPAEVVQRQVNGYNARNIDAFMATYSDDIELYRFPDERFVKGEEEMRNRYAKMFEMTPNLYCEIKNRMVLGNRVIDQEYVRKNDAFVNAIAVYEVNDGKITKVTFIK
ncbi:amidohydrolase family protein [Fulvivirga sp. M361]|uniref:amidohydrolase family protein n=1 Tax=Fulvivirga sp. M361 TaxID=2594266 RepID=UPI00162A07BE|nr:amidohydrolase family protein [Fulvivirga sp. M361]